MLDSGRNLPPDVKRNQRRDGTARELQNFAQLQRVESQRLQTNTHLPRTFSHKIDSCPCNVSARALHFVSVDGLRTMTTSQRQASRFTEIIDDVKISTGCEQRMHGG